MKDDLKCISLSLTNYGITCYLQFNFFLAEPVKQLSKKEKKKLEDEEFAKLMADMGVSGDAKKDESKPAAAASAAAAGDD